jgi:CubicO group peptidase (beta-lactamase class C family)
MPYPAILLSLVLLAAQTHAACYDPSPAFVPPKSRTYRDSLILKDAFKSITASLDKLIAQPAYDTHSFSIEITTSTDALWELHHTARDKDPARPGAEEVGGGSVYRVASITKAFTALAIIQQHVAGNLSIDDTIDQYLNLRGDIQWSDITLRTVASQLSGILRDCKIWRCGDAGSSVVLIDMWQLLCRICST